MKWLFFLSFLVLFGNFKCKNKLSIYQKQVEITNDLIKHINVNDFSSVKKMVGENSSEWGFDNDAIILSTSVINKMLQTATLEGVKKYKFKEYPKNSPNIVDIIVPIVGYNEKNEYIIVSFVKYIEVGKVFRFELVRDISEISNSQVVPAVPANKQ